MLENLAHLPTKITRFEQGDPVLAQWNYRISVHPIEGDFSIDMLEVRYDEAALRKSRQTRERYLRSRAARFDLEGMLLRFLFYRRSPINEHSKTLQILLPISNNSL